MEDSNLPLLRDSRSNSVQSKSAAFDEEQSLLNRVWNESKQLWHIVGPTIFSLLSSYTMFVIAQASAGHLGDLELAAMSLASNVIVGFDFGLLLGMASALETLCGQAFGAKNYPMLGIYLQRSWVILFCCCVLILPVYIFATPILKAFGQSAEVAELAGIVALWFIPLHFSFAFQFPLQRFLQSQLHNSVIGWVNFVALIVHLFLSWLVVFKLNLGLAAISLTLSFSWWVVVLGLLGYTMSGACAHSWTGFSFEAFSGLWPFFRLCVSSGVMLCLETWYYQVLVVIAGQVASSASAFDALSVCMTINGWENMIPIGFLIALGVRVANELGEGNGGKAKFATIVAVFQSVVLGLIFWVLIIFFHNKIALLFTTSKLVLKDVSKLSVLLAFTILLNSVQPILSGVAIGSGWQSYVAYINLGCYYLLGVPLGVLMGWVFKQGIMGIWAGMVFGGTAMQTLILAIVVIRCDWDKEALKASMRVNKWANT
ncbi:OLC1v1011243C5 [Oldenlandia corymbosa var. corymbosa]|uniref:Protein DETOXIFICATION n=2 Tax=Oldenlandia corymbosa var. corymbosa TaxID=529605 RepID=A0AAV1DWN1_OLDCO|nr:OLC1v1011243C5 [Oldenlandia corymbosa var. corymbosa]